MSLGERLLGGIKDLLVLREQVDRLAADSQRLTAIALDHERRLVRAETLLEMNGRPPPPRRLPKR